MNQLRKLVPLTIAVFVGVAYIHVLGAIWGHYVIYHPINDWLVKSLLVPGSKVAYYAVIYLHDVIVNVALAYPFALLVAAIKPKAPWKYLSISVLTIFVWTYGFVLFDPGPLDFFVDSFPVAIIGLFLTCGSLPLALLIVVKHRSHAIAV